MKQKGFAPILVVLVIAAIGAGYFVYKKEAPALKTFMGTTFMGTPLPVPSSSTTPTLSPIFTTAPTPSTIAPTVASPTAGSKITSPVSVYGSVPTGWMFEGIFPIKIVDSRRNLIVQGHGKEKVPGSWMSGSPVIFNATITFTTTAKSGYVILENDNPSGDPANTKSFEIPVKF